MDNRRAFSKFRLWGQGNFAHICFESSGCRFRKLGYCIMCDYGEGKVLTPQEVVDSFWQAIGSDFSKIQRILLGTCGSILDENEMDTMAFETLLLEIVKTDIKDVIFETHYTTVNEEKLKQIKSILAGEKISIEMGLESSNTDVVCHKLNKFMDLKKMTKVISQIHEMDFGVILNILLGSPEMESKEQLKDAYQTILWAFENGADEVVIFPVNIKPGTILWTQYATGKYHRVTGWMLAELLDMIPIEYLDKISISWYGDRQEQGVDIDILPMKFCNQCQPVLMDFFHLFMRDFDANTRKERIRAVLRKQHCKCQ